MRPDFVRNSRSAFINSMRTVPLVADRASGANCTAALSTAAAIAAWMRPAAACSTDASRGSCTEEGPCLAMSAFQGPRGNPFLRWISAPTREAFGLLANCHDCIELGADPGWRQLAGPGVVEMSQPASRYLGSFRALRWDVWARASVTMRD